MLSDLDLWRAAQIMVKRYGKDAATEAAMRSGSGRGMGRRCIEQGALTPASGRRSESLVRVDAFRACETYPDTTPALNDSRRRLRGHPEVRVA